MADPQISFKVHYVTGPNGRKLTKTFGVDGRDAILWAMKRLEMKPVVVKEELTVVWDSRTS